MKTEQIEFNIKILQDTTDLFAIAARQQFDVDLEAEVVYDDVLGLFLVDFIQVGRGLLIRITLTDEMQAENPDAFSLISQGAGSVAISQKVNIIVYQKCGWLIIEALFDRAKAEGLIS